MAKDKAPKAPKVAKVARVRQPRQPIDWAGKGQNIKELSREMFPVTVFAIVLVVLMVFVFFPTLNNAPKMVPAMLGLMFIVMIGGAFLTFMWAQKRENV